MNGRVIGGRYELSALLGQGGMGQVWIGYDRRLDRRVGVKLLRPDRVAGTPDGEEMRRRFVRECRVTAQVDHPGLVTVHDAGSDDEDLYLVMQYVEGADLSDHLAEHDPYPWPWAVSVAAQLCAVLASVHAVPIVHRDLKPRNVMIRPDGSVVILDLGIASALDTDTTRLTHTGSPIGSPAYMAPEQAMGGAVGPHTDLYALGVLLHELLSGEVPFAGSTALGVLHRHLHEEPVPVRTLRPDVPEALESLVLHLLRKDPQARPADAQEVYQALAPLLPTATIGPQAAQSPPTPLAPMDPTRPFRRPHAPWPVRSSGGPAPAPTPTALSTPQVPEPLVPAGAGAARAASAGAASAGSGSVGAASAGAAYLGPGSAAASVPAGASAARPAADPRTSAAPAARTSRPGAWTSASDPRTSSVSASSAASPSTSGPDVAAAVDEVKSLLDQGRITRAVDILGGILPAAAERHGAHSPVVRTLRKQYAATLMDDGQYRRALPELRLLAEEFAKESGAGATRQALQFHYEAAQCLEQLGEVAQALEEYRALLPYFEHYADDPVRPLEIRRSIGHLLLAQGERTAAQESLTRLLYDAERLHGPHHPFPEELRRTLYWLSQVQG
ncbi:protein kinase [Streptomyces sp. Je 1-4]|uniref:serine/threonine-protein kinase n=1 Tax=Streptomyces TaxID=1883 RepID=UPI0021DA3D10|nr:MULTISPECIES: serine/threonine-protein kinase [unclassified Streptomyces]UYB42020.1 protein kinase [Streptomyces sp. Je 1-4]UZQ38298.1 protein kinase [Streptomyces sp. Je 1-4] [Streptomyces sp. Je 1-4 4N24]UZQ45715.1 protein kinase [Streptomyces sp. Je 1-4] [Streptomyces sp. Je 1-4 4N24_ara]